MGQLFSSPIFADVIKRIENFERIKNSYIIIQDNDEHIVAPRRISLSSLKKGDLVRTCLRKPPLEVIHISSYNGLFSVQLSDGSVIWKDPFEYRITAKTGQYVSVFSSDVVKRPTYNLKVGDRIKINGVDTSCNCRIDKEGPIPAFALDSKDKPLLTLSELKSIFRRTRSLDFCEIVSIEQISHGKVLFYVVKPCHLHEIDRNNVQCFWSMRDVKHTLVQEFR